jgi:hypothetical protein
MSWLFRRRDPNPEPHLPHARPMTSSADDDRDALLALAVFACSTCGRTDLPETGDWKPPICEECDAALNFDALQEEMDDEND